MWGVLTDTTKCRGVRRIYIYTFSPSRRPSRKKDYVGFGRKPSSLRFREDPFVRAPAKTVIIIIHGTVPVAAGRDVRPGSDSNSYRRSNNNERAGYKRAVLTSKPKPFRDARNRVYIFRATLIRTGLFL